VKRCARADAAANCCEQARRHQRGLLRCTVDSCTLHFAWVCVMYEWDARGRGGARTRESCSRIKSLVSHVHGVCRESYTRPI